MSPLSLKVILTDISLGEDIVSIREAILSVLVHKWAVFFILNAQILKIWSHLSHLERVKVIWKNKWRNFQVQILSICETFNWRWLWEELLPDEMVIGRIWTKPIVEETNFNFRALSSKLVTRKLIHDWNTILSYDSTEKSYLLFHIYYL